MWGGLRPARLLIVSASRGPQAAGDTGAAPVRVQLPTRFRLVASLQRYFSSAARSTAGAHPSGTRRAPGSCRRLYRAEFSITSRLHGQAQEGRSSAAGNLAVPGFARRTRGRGRAAQAPAAWRGTRVKRHPPKIRAAGVRPGGEVPRRTFRSWHSSARRAFRRACADRRAPG